MIGYGTRKRSYQYKARPGQESSDEEECEETPDSQIESMRVYQLHEESEGWSRKPQTNKTAPLGATKSEKSNDQQISYFIYSLRQHKKYWFALVFIHSLIHSFFIILHCSFCSLQFAYLT